MNEPNNRCIGPEELSAHLDGDLDESRALEVEEHIKNCVRCYGVVRDFGDLKADLKDLGLARPGLNLWRRIDDALDEEPQQKTSISRWLGWLLPIPVAAAAALAILLLRPADHPQDPGKDHADQTSQAKTQDIAQAMESVERAEAAYLEAIYSLEKVYKTEKSNFNKDTLAVIEQSLGEIDTAIDRCRKAMILDPANMDANRAMLAAYRQKMDFLFELVGPKGPTSRSVE